MNTTKKPNHLISEKSPYLLQHAYNPVEWYPWSEEAFSKARAEQKPIFLSVGYSTCHWCHVMEHESFENEFIAGILNKHFVSIKVDREERPDVDKVYMTALQGMGQGGGWPMSMFLTPELKPFFGGTYFPPETRHGRAGFPDLLMRIQELWEKERGKLVESADVITTVLRGIHTSTGKSTMLNGHVMDLCYSQFKQTYDPHSGGFGGAPKFPRPSVFDFLFKYYHRTGNPEALTMAVSTLVRMADGGIYDHIGGGFHRYSVDAGWRVPHFEKMLYDQAQLIRAHVAALRLTGQPVHAVIIRETLEYVLRDMTDGKGGFYSAEDADSERPDEPGEHGEGAFYVWTSKEIADVLGEDDGKIFCFVYGVEPSGNVQSDPHHEFTGRNILYRSRTNSEAAATFGISEVDVSKCLDRSRGVLFQARSKRPRPHCDDKILTSWNGLMIGACAQAFQVLGDERYRQAGERAANFILRSMYNLQEGTLVRRYRDGQAGLEAHLDDYAFLVEGLLDLYESTFDLRWMDVAIKLTQAQIRLFWDEKNGGFFDTSGVDPSILVRMKEMYDGAEPAGNSVAVMNLLRLSSMTDNGEWKEKTEHTLRAFSEAMDKQPTVMPATVSALIEFLTKPRQVVIAGPLESPRTRELISEVWRRYLPGKVLLCVHDEDSRRAIAGYVPVGATMNAKEGNATAYTCEDFVCRLPTSDPDKLGRLLDQPSLEH